MAVAGGRRRWPFEEMALRVLRVSHSAVVGAWRERERALRQRGHAVELMSARRWNEGGADIDLEPRADERVIGVRTAGRHPALFLYDPLPLWRALGGKWDVIDIHEEPYALSTAEVLLIRWLRRQRAPYVLYSAQNIEKRYPIPFRWLERTALRGASGASVCNKEAGRILRRKGLRMGASLIPLGTDLRRFSTRPDSRELGGEHATVRVGFAGRLEQRKGVDVLLDAVAGDERLYLRIAGAGPDEQVFRSRAALLGLLDRVEFVGSLGQRELPDFYRSLDVLAVPSLTTPGWVEQFGRVAVEAMAAGTPVVASASGALPDVVGGAGVLVPPGDAAALRTALLSVGQSPTLSAQLRATGLDRAAATAWDCVAELYEGLYSTAVYGPALAEAVERPVEVIVVAYGAPDLLRKTLAPLRGELVLVVDNSSSGAVRALCEELGVRYVDPGANRGFAAGVNEGLRHRLHQTSDVLLLNPDAVIQPSGIRELQKALHADERLASVGPVQLDASGREDRVVWPFPTPLGSWADAVGLGRLRRGKDYVIGSILLLRAEAIAEVGELDEQFFLYAEETDWAYRASRLGWTHELVPTVAALHLGSATSSDPLRRETHFHASQERYLRKHFGAAGWSAARAAVVIGSALRSLAPGSRGSTARHHLGLYLRGPVEVERSMGAPSPDGAAS